MKENSKAKRGELLEVWIYIYSSLKNLAVSQDSKFGHCPIGSKHYPAGQDIVRSYRTLSS
jgi:hypothetical protein